jgi:hypothetical protein
MAGGLSKALPFRGRAILRITSYSRPYSEIYFTQKTAVDTPTCPKYLFFPYCHTPILAQTKPELDRYSYKKLLTSNPANRIIALPHYHYIFCGRREGIYYD